MQTKKFKLHYLIIAVLFVFFLSFLTFRKKDAEKVENDPVIKTTSVKKSNLDMPIKVSGFIKGANRADVAPMANGRIIKITKKEGDFIKKGEVLAIIDSKTSSIQTSAAQSGVEALNKILKDTEDYYGQLVKETRENSSANKETIDSAKKARDLQIQSIKAKIIEAEGNFKIASSNQENFSVTAPFSGKILSLYLKEGDFANFSYPIANISTDNNFEIESYVSSSESKKIKLGDNVILFSSDDIAFSGNVTTIAPGSSEQNFKTLIKIKPSKDISEIIRLGDFVNGNIFVAREKETILIPRNSIITKGSDSIVFIFNEKTNTVEEKIIKILDEYDNNVNIESGINENDMIVTEGQQYLVNGLKVKINGNE